MSWTMVKEYIFKTFYTSGKDKTSARQQLCDLFKIQSIQTDLSADQQQSVQKKIENQYFPVRWIRRPGPIEQSSRSPYITSLELFKIEGLCTGVQRPNQEKFRQENEEQEDALKQIFDHQIKLRQQKMKAKSTRKRRKRKTKTK